MEQKKKIIQFGFAFFCLFVLYSARKDIRLNMYNLFMIHKRGLHLITMLMEGGKENWEFLFLGEEHSKAGNNQKKYTQQMFSTAK
jgi:hypothetical protein